MLFTFSDRPRRLVTQEGVYGEPQLRGFPTCHNRSNRARRKGNRRCISQVHDTQVLELVPFEYWSTDPLTERIGWEGCGAARKRNQERMGCRRRRLSLDYWSGTQEIRVKHLGSLRCDR